MDIEAEQGAGCGQERYGPDSSPGAVFNHNQQPSRTSRPPSRSPTQPPPPKDNPSCAERSPVETLGPGFVQPHNVHAAANNTGGESRVEGVTTDRRAIRIPSHSIQSVNSAQNLLQYVHKQTVEAAGEPDVSFELIVRMKDKSKGGGGDPAYEENPPGVVDLPGSREVGADAGDGDRGGPNSPPSCDDRSRVASPLNAAPPPPGLSQFWRFRPRAFFPTRFPPGLNRPGCCGSYPSPPQFPHPMIHASQDPFHRFRAPFALDPRSRFAAALAMKTNQGQASGRKRASSVNQHFPESSGNQHDFPESSLKQHDFPESNNANRCLFPESTANQSHFSESSANHRPFSESSAYQCRFPESTTNQHPYPETNVNQRSFPDSNTNQRPVPEFSSANKRQFPESSANQHHFPESTANQHPYPETNPNQRSFPDSNTNQRPVPEFSSANQRQFPESTANQCHFPESSANQRHFPGSTANKHHFSESRTNQRQFPESSDNQRQFPESCANLRQFPEPSANQRQFPESSANQRQFPESSANQRQLPEPSANQRQFPESSANQRQFHDSAANQRQFHESFANQRQFPESNKRQFPESPDNQHQFPDSSVNQRQFPESSANQRQFPESSTNQRQFPESSTNQRQFPESSTNQLQYPESSTNQKLLHSERRQPRLPSDASCYSPGDVPFYQLPPPPPPPGPYPVLAEANSGPETSSSEVCPLDSSCDMRGDYDASSSDLEDEGGATSNRAEKQAKTRTDFSRFASAQKERYLQMYKDSGSEDCDSPRSPYPPSRTTSMAAKTKGSPPAKKQAVGTGQGLSHFLNKRHIPTTSRGVFRRSCPAALESTPAVSSDSGHSSTSRFGRGLCKRVSRSPTASATSPFGDQWELPHRKSEASPYEQHYPTLGTPDELASDFALESYEKSSTTQQQPSSFRIVKQDGTCKTFIRKQPFRPLDSSSPLGSSSSPGLSPYSSRLRGDNRLSGSRRWGGESKEAFFKEYKTLYVDTHCHLDFLFNREPYSGSFASYREKNKTTFPANFEGCVAVFCNPKSFTNEAKWKSVAEEPRVWMAMGCHPKSAPDYNDWAELGLRKALTHKKTVALGEIGLDYSKHYGQRKEQQKEVFIRQIKIALEMQLPLVIHCREAEDDCLAILQKYVPSDYKIHCHCFTTNYQSCLKWTSRFENLFIGLTPLVTYRSASETHEVARNLPLNKLLLETDAPYFLPCGFDGEGLLLSHPGMALMVAIKVAELRGITVEEVLVQVRLNTHSMYGV